MQMFDKPLKGFADSTVMIVDDHGANIELLQTVLQDHGLTRIVGVTDSRKVKDLLPQVEPDLVLLDMLMPHLDGHVVLDQIVRYAAGAYLPVLVLTADVTTLTRHRALAHGARDFLTK